MHGDNVSRECVKAVGGRKLDSVRGTTTESVLESRAVEMSSCSDYSHGVFRACEWEVLGVASAVFCSEWVWDLRSRHTTGNTGKMPEKKTSAPVKTLSVMW